MEFKRDNNNENLRSSANHSDNLSSDNVLSNFSPPPFQLKAEQQLGGQAKEGNAETINTPFQFAVDGSSPPSVPNEGNGSDLQKLNNTGLPTQLKSGVEKLSGFSLNDVKVHYNSPKPAQLKAHAYAQGTDIHVASGQEKHVPHEAWHVVQQKQGRVQPTMQMKGNVNVNDDQGLENEADKMGSKAMEISSKPASNKAFQLKSIGSTVVQRAINSEDELKVKMGAYKFGQAKKKSLLHVFEDMSDEDLQEILAQPRKTFDYDLEFGYLERDELQDAEPETFLGKILSRFGWGGGTKEGEKAPEMTNIPLVEEYAQGEREKGGNKQSLTKEGAAALFEEEGEGGEQEEEGGLGDAIISQIEIDLGSAKIPESAKANMGRLGEASAEGEASLKGSKEGFKGEAKIEIKAGRGGKKKLGLGTFGTDGTNISAGGTLGGHVGVKVGAEGSAEFNPANNKAQVKGKMGASLGASVDTTAQINVRGGGMDLGKFTAALGMMVGIGGELSYIAKWDGGMFTLGSSGKASLGLGFTWGYKMQVNAPGMLAKIGDSLSSWARWGMDVLSYLDTG